MVHNMKKIVRKSAFFVLECLFYDFRNCVTLSSKNGNESQKKWKLGSFKFSPIVSLIKSRGD